MTSGGRWGRRSYWLQYVERSPSRRWSSELTVRAVGQQSRSSPTRRCLVVYLVRGTNLTAYGSWTTSRPASSPLHSRKNVSADDTGTRGATSAEYFLKAGYAVIFLHRLHSLRPFSRHYSHSLNPFLDLLTITESTSPDGQPSVTVDKKYTATLIPILQAYHTARAQGTLLSIDFQTVNEYLWLLRAIAKPMSTLGRKGMFYLAAAVSDFFLPDDKVVR